MSLIVLSFSAIAQINSLRPALVQIRLGTGIGQTNWTLTESTSNQGSSVSYNKTYANKGVYIPLTADALVRLDRVKVGVGIGTDFNIMDSVKNGIDGTGVFRKNPNFTKYYAQFESEILRLGGVTVATNFQGGGFDWVNFKSTIKDKFFVNAGILLNINNSTGLGIYVKPTIEYKQQNSVLSDPIGIPTSGPVRIIDRSFNYYIAFGITYGLF